jgi:hypothetical protein
MSQREWRYQITLHHVPNQSPTEGRQKWPTDWGSIKLYLTNDRGLVIVFSYTIAQWVNKSVFLVSLWVGEKKHRGPTGTPPPPHPSAPSSAVECLGSGPPLTPPRRPPSSMPTLTLQELYCHRFSSPLPPPSNASALALYRHRRGGHHHLWWCHALPQGLPKTVTLRWHLLDRSIRR